MAGRGSRLRPHTLVTPKPLVNIAGKPIVHRLVEDIVAASNETVDEIAFIIGDFGLDAEKKLKEIAKKLDAKSSIYYQEEPLGTAHAILCAKESLSGNCVVAFADTLFEADFTINNNEDGIIWVSKIDDPSSFGVVKTNENNIITDFVEKPTEFVSDLAIIGIYYFKDGEYLKKELEYLINNNIKDKGEFQLTSALENMKNKGVNFVTGKVSEWMDCGNKEAAILTNTAILKNRGHYLDQTANIEDSTVIKPCYIGKNVKIKNSVVGPHVAVADGVSINHSTIKNTIIQKNSTITNTKLNNSMIGSEAHVDTKSTACELSIGDFSTIK